jgi:hypothetical protein
MLHPLRIQCKVSGPRCDRLQWVATYKKLCAMSVLVFNTVYEIEVIMLTKRSVIVYPAAIHLLLLPIILENVLPQAGRMCAL